MFHNRLLIIVVYLLLLYVPIGTKAQRDKSIYVVAKDVKEMREHPCVVPGKIVEEKRDRIANIVYADSSMTIVHNDGTINRFFVNDIKNVTTHTGGFYVTTSFLPEKIRYLLDFDSRFEYPGVEDVNAYVKEDQFSTQNVVYITLNNDIINVEGDTTFVNVRIDNDTLYLSSMIAGIEYRISGSTESSCIVLGGDYEIKIVLDNAFVTNPDGASIISNVVSPIYVTSTAGSFNALSGIHANGLVNLYGEGVLKLTSEVDEIALLSSTENIHIYGGVFDFFVSGVDSKGIHAKRELVVDGGDFYVITTGASNDHTEESLGELRTYGILANELVTINAGKFFVKTFGLKLEGQTEGSGAVGIGSLANMTINGGEFYLACFDDPVNATKTITMNGGNFVTSSLTDDGFNSNTLKVSGGNILAYGPDGGFDTKSSNAFTVYGGTLIGFGPKSSKSKTGAGYQASLYFKDIVGVQKFVRIIDENNLYLKADEKSELIFETPRLEKTGIYLSSPYLTKEISYYIETSDDKENWRKIEESITLCK